MKANLHTHTTRCGHAVGTDREYVQAALRRGFDVLGFSDHVPWPYKSGFIHHGVRMTVGQLDEYLESVRSLRDEYAGQLRILAGFECEYFPEYMDWLADMAQEKELDYLILGNHYDTTDETGMYFGRTCTAAELSRYVDSAVSGLRTGLFSYLAHPDLFMRGYDRFDEDCRAAARDLAAACKALNVPMEYNLHARYEAEAFGDSYPNAEFFEIVREAGVPVVIGIDAHSPEEIKNPAQWNRARLEVKEFGNLYREIAPLRGFSRK